MGKYLPVGSNEARAARAAVRRIAYSSEEEEEVPVESSKKNMKWRPQNPQVYKYVDDNLQVHRVNMETAGRGRDPDPFRDKHAVACQNVFRRTIRRAEERGMRVNEAKTAMVCVSGAQSYDCLLYTSPSPRD